MRKFVTDYTGAELVKLAVGAGAYSSSPAWGGKGQSPAANPHAVTSNPTGGFGQELGKALAPVGRAVWNNGGKQTLRTGLNTLHGIGTTATGMANVGAGIVGTVGGGLGRLGGIATDAAGFTNGANDWIDHNILRHTTNAINAGFKDTVGGAADVLSGGYYDHDGTLAGPGHAGTAVEQMRSGIRDELGRGSGFDTAFNATNGIADFAASQAAFGGVGRGLNVGAQALKGSQTVAPVLNTVAKTPVVGKPLATAGNWLAGPAPAANMFRQSPAQYYRASSPLSAADDVANAGNILAESANEIDRPAAARMYNEEIRPHIENAYPMSGAVNQARRQDGTDYSMPAAMLNDPAMRNRMSHGAVPQEVAPQLMQAANVPPELQQEYATAVSSNAPSLTSPAATQPSPQGGPSVAQQPPAPAPEPKPFESAQATLTEAKTPEQKAEIEKTLVPQLTEHVQTTTPPEKVKAVQAVAQDPNSPAAQRTVEEGRSAFATEQAGGDSSKLQNPDFFGQVMGLWNGLGAPGQMAFMLGVPTALIGLLSGDGLTGLLGGLGIGGLGIAGAAGGLFGHQAQAATGKMLGDMGNFFGVIPDEARDAANLMPGSPAAQKMEAEVAKVFQEQGPEAAQKLIDAQTAKFAPLEQMHKLNPSFAHSFLMGMNNGPKTPEEAQKLYDQVAAQVAQARDPNFLRNKAIETATNKVRGMQNLVPSGLRVGARLGLDLIPGARSMMPSSVQDMIDAASTDPRVIAEREIAKRYKTGADMNIAQRIITEQLITKAARCWAGYEPVPGKAPYSENSCRPKSKKKKKTEKKAEQQYSAQPFNPAIGYKHPNPNAAPMDIYKHQMRLSGDEAAKAAKNPRYRFSNAYTTAMQHYGGLPPRPPVPPTPAPTYANSPQQQAIFNKYQAQIQAIK